MMQQNAEHFVPVVVTPTYNNDRTLADVLQRVLAMEWPVIAINDGSTDSTPAILEQLRAAHPPARLQIFTHAHNRGKAAALQTGFTAAANAGFTHAITLDTDGQHDPEEIPLLFDQARREPRAYVLGYRDDTRPDYPARTRLGRRVSNFLVLLESGLHVRDSQCGMRVYPLRLAQTVRCRAGRFGYETEMITRAAWARCPIVEVPIVTRYLPPGQRVSHFRPWVDTFRGIAMHAGLVGRALLPWPHPKYVIEDSAMPREPIARAIWRWLNPANAWRELRAGQISRGELSAALAVGVFIANLPAYGFQTVLSLYAARRLHLQPVAVVAGSHISIPPVAPFLVAAAVGIGHLLLHGSWSAGDLLHGGWKDAAGSLLLDWCVGGVVVGFLLAIAVFLLSQLAFSAVKLTSRTESKDLDPSPRKASGPSTHPAGLLPAPAPANP